MLRVLENGRRSLWTLRQLRFELRKERRKVMARWPDGKRQAGSAWYRAAKLVLGCAVTKLTDERQRALPTRIP